MTLKLDPRHPMLWRTPSSLQFGVDPALIRLEEVSETEERLLAALAVGVSRPGLTMLARGNGTAVDRLLDALAPVMLEPLADRIDLVAISGTGPIVDALANALEAAGVHLEQAADGSGARPDLAILVNGFVTPPALHGLWLRRDVPHLPLVASDGGVTIGPVVEPGSGPCLLCLELHRRDADPAWPAIATQLLGRTPHIPSPLVLEAAATACRIATARFAGGPGRAVSVRIDAETGRRDYLDWLPHPDCGCRGIEHLLERRQKLEPQPS